MTSEERQHCVVHYGEVSLKGKNRPAFTHLLADNIRQALSDIDHTQVRMLSGRILVSWPLEATWDEVAARLQGVFGVANYARCWQASHDLDSMKSVVDRLLQDRTFSSFRISARRAFKQLPFGSQELNQEMGTHVLATHDTRVNLNHPDLTVHIELIPRRTLIYLEKEPGAGGLPLGMSGRLLSLLSGGLDSPVAAYRMMKRGCQVDFIHFHSYPFMDRRSQDKARCLARILTRHQYQARLFLVPFGEIQQHIVGTAPPPYRVVLYRRCMVRIAEALARKEGATALVTGESLGQVASQTLQNLHVIASAAALPVLRPLIGMDKAEIMQEAQAIGTFATSVLPDQDCCTLFVPRHPSTKALPARIGAAEMALDIPALVQMALDGVQTVDLRFPEVSQRAAKVPGS
jgi:thiamine biosynthesis protein ThiI